MALDARKRCMRSGEWVGVRVPCDVIPRRFEASLFVTIQARCIATLELTSVGVVMAAFAPTRNRNKLLDACCLFDRMARNAFKCRMRRGQWIRLGMQRGIEPRWLEVILIVAIKTARVTALELIGMRIIMAALAPARDGDESLHACIRIGGVTRFALHRSVGADQRIGPGVLSHIKAGRREMGLVVAVQTRRITALELIGMRIIMAALALTRDGDKPLNACVRIGNVARLALHGGMCPRQRKYLRVFGRIVLRWSEMVLLVTIQTARITRAELAIVWISMATFAPIRLPDIA